MAVNAFEEVRDAIEAFTDFLESSTKEQGPLDSILIVAGRRVAGEEEGVGDAIQGTVIMGGFDEPAVVIGVLELTKYEVIHDTKE